MSSRLILLLCGNQDEVRPRPARRPSPAPSSLPVVRRSFIYITFFHRDRFLFESAFLWVYRANVHRIICRLKSFYLSVDNGPEITKAINSVLPWLKEGYNYDSTVKLLNSSSILFISSLFDSNLQFFIFSAIVLRLYRSFTQCQSVEDEGDIVFYKNRGGKAVRAIHPGPSVIVEMKEKETQHRVEMKFGDVAGVSDKDEEF